MMNAVREALLDRMIRIYGFEHEIVIEFARFAENLYEGKPYDELLTCLVESHEEFPIVEEDDEEQSSFAARAVLDLVDHRPAKTAQKTIDNLLE